MSVVKDKVILITGGAGGIGSAFAKELLKNGAKGIVVVDIFEEGARNLLQQIQQDFGQDKAIFVKTDVTDKKQFEEAFQTTIQRYKQLDIVINNAAITDEIEWEKTLALNLQSSIQGSYLAMQKYLPKYKSGDEGIIINIASVLGFLSLESFPLYCASKSGLITFGQCIGKDEFYKKFKTRVLTVCPGAVNTEMLRRNTEKCITSEDISKQGTVDLNLLEEPEEIAEALTSIIAEGRNGSVWVKEDHTSPYEISFPDYRSLKKRT